MTELLGCRLNVVLPHGHLLLRIGLGLYPSPAVKAAVVDDRGIDHCTIDISVVDHRGVDVDDSRVITEITAMPFPANETRSSIAVAIVHPAIKSDMRAPVSAMPAIDATGITPVTGRP